MLPNRATPSLPAVAARRERGASLAIRVASAALASWILPERLWLPLTGTVGWMAVQMNRREARQLMQAMGELMGVSDGAVLRQLAIERIASGHAARLYGLRQYRPGGIDTPVTVRGLEQIDRALQEGRGAILWVARFAYSSLVTKMGLHAAGVRVSHLSRPTHGFGTSEFAVRRLNRIWTRIEERHLRERIVMEPGRETAALRALRRRLAENGVVSITVGDEGVQTVTVPLLEGAIRLATGPATLARAGRAPLLPVFTVRSRSGGFAVHVQSPLEPEATTDPDEHARAVAVRYAERLAPFVREYAGQWLGIPVTAAGIAR